MSFGGSVSAMIATMKNNARSKRKSYFDRDNSLSKNKKTERNALLDKKASPELLAEIRKRMKSENKKIRTINTAIIIVTLTFVISALLLFNI